jgi:hypothetical protein
MNLRMTEDEIVRRGQEQYEQSIRPRVEREENIGKLVWIDVETGEYEIGDDSDLDAPLRLHARHPGAEVVAMRIGYNAVDAVGGVLGRTVIGSRAGDGETPSPRHRVA